MTSRTHFVMPRRISKSTLDALLNEANLPNGDGRKPTNLDVVIDEAIDEVVRCGTSVVTVSLNEHIPRVNHIAQEHMVRNQK